MDEPGEFAHSRQMASTTSARTVPRPPHAQTVEATGTTGVSAAEAGAILTVDLAAIRANYRVLCERAGGAECAGVVKADGYGLGAAPVARALMQEGCRTFFVAHLREAALLRRAFSEGGSTASDTVIYVLNGLPPGTEAESVAIGATPVLNSLAQVAAWRAEANRLGRRLKGAIQVDSGMARIGLSPVEVDTLATEPGLLSGIEPTLLMSHLACADQPEHPANALQLRRFEILRRRLPAAPLSLANSSGIFLGADYAFDMVRPGAALYGINPTPGRPNPMRQVVALKARIIQIRNLPAGEGVGYGYSYRTVRSARLATLSLGYADGWSRYTATASAFFGSFALPIVGRVSMDSVIVDISAVPDDAIREGDMVEMLGPHQTVDDVAAEAGTIGYEVLTGFGYRFHRIYPGGAETSA